MNFNTNLISRHSHSYWRNTTQQSALDTFIADRISETKLYHGRLDLTLFQRVFLVWRLGGWMKTLTWTATAICEAFENTLWRWNIIKKRVDNVCNIAQAMEEWGVSGLGCMTHTLQLAVKKRSSESNTDIWLCFDREVGILSTPDLTCRLNYWLLAMTCRYY